MKQASLTLATITSLALVGGCGTPSKSMESASSRQVEVSVMTYNIWHDQRDWPVRLDYMMQGIREIDPDVIGLQEVIQRETLPNQADTISEALGYSVFFSSVDPPERAQRYGNAILSRYPIIETNMRKLQPLDDYRTVAHAVIDKDGLLIDVYNTHFHHTREGSSIRATQIADLLDFIEETRRSEQVILMGDFNAEVTWEEMQPLQRSFTDTFALFVSDPDSGDYPTLNYHLGHSVRRIDHIFLESVTNPSWIPTNSRIVLNEQGPNGVWASDHFGVVTSFRRAQ